MTRQELSALIRTRGSFLCVGLDPDYSKMPQGLRTPEGVVTFCKEIIEATKEYAVAYKPNIAFFEALGRKGWDILYQVAELLPSDTFNIADAKRADIGNSSARYAHAFLNEMHFDAVTVAPYMGSDSVEPFLQYEGKWAVLLALTSNKGSHDFQRIEDGAGKPLYQQVMQTAATWGSPDKLMYVVGATHPEMLEAVRSTAPDHFFLVPGVGAQGGSLEAVAKTAMNKDVGLLVNSTRAVIYASNGSDFAEKAAEVAQGYQQEMSAYL